MVTRNLPPLSALRAFEAFARTGSMTAAAVELAVTHGAVSRSVRALQLNSGVQLVEGPRHSLRLTPAGHKLAQTASVAFDMISESMPAPAASEVIFLSCFGTLAMKWLIPRLPDFYKARPGARIRIVEEHGPVDFSKGRIDAAIRLDDAIPHGSRFVRFMAHHHGPVLSAQVWDSCRTDPKEVLQLPRLVSETFPMGWQEWSEGAGVGLPNVPDQLVFEHNSYMLEAAVAGLGVAIAPWGFAEADVVAGRLVAPFGFRTLPFRFTLIRPAIGENPAIDAFSRWLQRQGRASSAPPRRDTSSLISEG